MTETEERDRKREERDQDSETHTHTQERQTDRQTEKGDKTEIERQRRQAGRRNFSESLGKNSRHSPPGCDKKACKHYLKHCPLHTGLVLVSLGSTLLFHFHFHLAL